MDFVVEYTDNVYVPNDVLRVLPASCESAAPLPGICWITYGQNVYSAHKDAARHAVQRIRSRLPQLELYLLAHASGTWADNRINRYKLARAYPRFGVPLPGRDCGAWVLPVSNGFLPVGLRCLADDDVDVAVELCDERRASLLAAVPGEREAELAQVVWRGWGEPTFHPDPALLRDVAMIGGIALWPVGWFDDIEAGIAAVAGQAVVGELVRG